MRWSVLALAFCVGCSGPTTLDDWSCPSGGTPLDYQNFGAAFFSKWCNSCHSASPGERQGAPEDVVLDTQAGVKNWRERIFVRAAANNDSMPPGPNDPPESERDKLADWLACGAP
jgi:uncharacterized membrane protein